MGQISSPWAASLALGTRQRCPRCSISKQQPEQSIGGKKNPQKTKMKTNRQHKPNNNNNKRQKSVRNKTKLKKNKQTQNRSTDRKMEALKQSLLLLYTFILQFDIHNKLQQFPNNHWSSDDAHTSIILVSCSLAHFRNATVSSGVILYQWLFQINLVAGLY